MRDEREARLPKWAQAELDRLRREVETQRQINAELRGEVGETRIHVVNYTGTNQPIRDGSAIRFRMGDDRWDESITARVEHGRLVLHGGRSLVVRPHVSNAIQVSLDDR